MTGIATACASASVPSISRPASTPSRAIVGIDDRGDAGILEAAAELGGFQLGAFRPAFHRDAALARIDADGDLARKAPRRLAHEAGVADRRGPDDGAGDPLREPGLEGPHVADPAAELHGQANRGQDRVDRRRVHRRPGESAIQIDDMEMAEALAFERRGLGGGIVVEDGGLRHVAELEADALPGLQVDCGIEDHGRHRRKLARRARPRAWLFSGWNCVPTIVSRPITAAIGPA